jgi:hypothetical protein
MTDYADIDGLLERANQAVLGQTARAIVDELAEALRAERAAREADVTGLETGNSVMREEFDRLCEALQEQVGGEGLGGEWYPDLVAGVVEERDRLRSELCAARQDLDVAESRKSEAFHRLAAERDKAATHLREALDRERMSLVDFNAEVATLRAELFAARQDLGVEGKP